jgi:hypothetical protein
MVRNLYKLLVRKTEGKRPVGRLSIRDKIKIKIDLKELCCGLDSSGSE